MMRVGKDITGGFQILSDRGDVIADAYRDEKSGLVHVIPNGSYAGPEQMPGMTQDLQTFAEEEFRKRAAKV